MSSRTGKIVYICSLALGVGLLVTLCLRLDFAQVTAQIAQVGWYFGASFSVYVSGLFVTTLAWKHLIDQKQSSARLKDLFATFWIGHSINELTPAGSLGEVYKGIILKDKISSNELIASLVVFNFLSTCSMLMFNLVGPVLCLIFLDLPIHVVLALFGVAIAFLVPVVLLFFMLRAGAASWIVRIYCKLPFIKLKNPEKIIEKAKSIDRSIKETRRRDPKSFNKSLFWLACARLLQAGEVWIILLALIPDRDPVWLLLLAVLIQTASQLLAWVMTFVPGKLGVAEGGSTLLFKLLGMSSVIGLSMELVRRMRMIIGVSIGLIIGWRVGLRPSSALPRDSEQRKREPL